MNCREDLWLLAGVRLPVQEPVTKEQLLVGFINMWICVPESHRVLKKGCVWGELNLVCITVEL